MNQTQNIINLELSLLRPEIRSSKSELKRLLTEDFLEIASSGISFDKSDALARIPSESQPEFKASDFVLRELAKNTIQLIYKATIKRQGNDKIHYSLRSSIWIKNDSDWQMLFHQGTPCNPF